MKRFTIRIYGVLIQNDAVLVSDEFIHERHITKFPGGGLEFGESTTDCLKREFKEEMNLEVEISSHLYTTDFFVASAFDEHCQVMSIYYLVETKQQITVPISEKPHDYKLENNTQAFRWIPINTISEDDFTFVIDKKVAETIKSS
ncbi:MAG: NUDIX domain-containing protein [Bacteroidota bacterium]|nr:NUDIX domain-containing protein [Bacteroidota bacterium]